MDTLARQRLDEGRKLLWDEVAEIVKDAELSPAQIEILRSWHDQYLRLVANAEERDVAIIRKMVELMNQGKSGVMIYGAGHRFNQIKEFMNQCRGGANSEIAPPPPASSASSSTPGSH